MSDEFERLLAETGIAFVPPAGFSPFPVRDASVFRYHRAYRHASGAEVRFRIDSLQRLQAEMRGSLPANFSDSAFLSGVMNLGGGEIISAQEWNADKAEAYFRADWVRCAHLRPADPQFAPGHDLAVVHYFHRAGVADVYLIGLYKEGADVEGLILGEEPPVRFPERSQAQARSPAAQHSPAYLEAWGKACALVDGCLNLDGRPLPAPDDAERRRLAEAIPLFEEAARLEPGNAGPPLFISKTLERLGDFPASLAAIRRAHAIFPDNVTVILELGGALGRCGLHAEAVPILREGARGHPSDPRIHANLGLALLLSGDARSAVSAFERLVKLEPNGPHNTRLLWLAIDVAAERKPVPRSEREVSELLAQPATA